MRYSEQFRVKPGAKVELRKIDAGFKDKHENHASAMGELEHYTRRLAELQYLMYAENRRSLLIVLQAMDAGGKDGTINHVFAALNPQGCAVHGFKAPSSEELAHDYLWRIHKAAPPRGQVCIFNRSHYEDVLVVRVHNIVPKEVWSRRYDEINAFERQLADNGTHILKFYLHIDREEQLERFKQRIDDPARHWKISESDYAERAHWDDYQQAFEDAISRCSTDYAPWYVIPANHKWFRNLAVSQILVETMESLKMTFPPPSVDIEDVKRKYHAAEEAEAKQDESSGHKSKGNNKKHKAG
jgi:PPK2 family polyphosphate:nucleotide phosphotransferase